MIRVYGTQKGNTSWPRVTAGMVQGLEEIGELASFFEIGEMFEIDDCVETGHDASIGVFVGAPNRCKILRSRGEHPNRLAIVAANSSWLPEGTLRWMRESVTGLIGPSTYSCEVLRNYSEGLPVYLWPHGVSRVFAPGQDYISFGKHARDVGKFRVLHLASTYMERKGTEQLIEAWCKLIREGLLPSTSTLNIVLDPPHGYAQNAIDKYCVDDQEYQIKLHHPVNMSEHDMRSMFLSHHLVCQPSRCEGFGMIPVESRACGVPVCATACTGHADHIDADAPGVAVIKHGEDAPIDDGPGAMAPSVSSFDVAESLIYAYDNWDKLATNAADHYPKLISKWSWAAGCERFLQEFNK